MILFEVMGASYKNTFETMGKGYQNTAGILTGTFDPAKDPLLGAMGMKKPESPEASQRMAGQAAQPEMGLTAFKEFVDPIQLKVTLAKHRAENQRVLEKPYV